MTVIEVEAKMKALELEQTQALEVAKLLTPATAEFDEAYQRYLSAKASILKIPDERSKAKLEENADAIKVAQGQFSEAIVKLAEGLKIEELIGKPLTALRFAIDSEGVKIVVFNPVTTVRATSGSKGKGAGHTQIVDSQGNVESLTKFVKRTMTDAESGTDAFKYPHTRVDTKPKFDAYCEAHSLTGLTYQLPADATAESETVTPAAPATPATPAVAPAPAPAPDASKTPDPAPEVKADAPAAPAKADAK